MAKRRNKKISLTPSGVNVNGTTGNVGVSGSVSTSGNVGGGANANVTDNVSVGVSGGVNPASGSGNIGANVGVHGGDVTQNIGVGFNPATGQVGVTPTLQIGQGSGSQGGAQIGGGVGAGVGAYFGGPLGAAAGAEIGSAVGSIVGGQFNPSIAHLEHNARDSVLNSFKDAGLWGEDNSFLFPDGTTFNFAQKGGDNQHDWKYADKRKDKAGDRKLYNYEIDYTNDTDYVAGMAGISFARLFSGAKNKAIDQMGNQLGNAFLGTVGYGSEFNQENFNKVVTNARSLYAKAGIQSKEDMLALANKAFSEGRINDADYAVQQQTAGIIFDSDFNLAQSLMGGRWGGVETANQTPSDKGASAPAKKNPNVVTHDDIKNIRVISAQEALASVKPFFDYYKQNYGGNFKNKGPSSTAQDIASGAGVVTAGISLIKNLDNATGGHLGNGIKDIANSLGLTDAPTATSDELNPSLDFSVGGSDIDTSPSDFQLDSSIDYSTSAF